MLAISLRWLNGQVEEGHYIQIDGMTADENGAILPDVSIYSKHLRRGAASNHRGIFSIISIPGDTVFFSAIGYKSTLLTIPADISGDHFITDIIMITDTIEIGDVLVLPWKSYSEFKRAVVENKPADPLKENLEHNLAMIRQQLWSDHKITPDEAYHYIVQGIADNLYQKGQGESIRLLDPFAWQRFAKGVKSGLLKNEPSDISKVKKSKIRKKKKKSK